MIFRFTKMHGLGNDFMVIDGITQNLKLRSRHVRKLADRHFGVGFDQLLLVEPPTEPDADFCYRIYNADGEEVEQCGNGARCFARFVHDQKLTNKRQIRVQTRAGIIELDLQKNGWVHVDMGTPVLEPERIPFKWAQRQTSYPLPFRSATLDIAAVSMGNPHMVLRVDDVDTAPVPDWGPELEQHPLFPQRVNVGFLQVVDGHHGRLRVFERGVGETLACGTGACAAVVAGCLQGWFEPEAEIELPGGLLRISWQGEGASVMMSGPTERVFEGQVKI